MHSSYDNTDTDTTKFSHRSLEQLTGYDTLTEHNYLPSNLKQLINDPSYINYVV